MWLHGLTSHTIEGELRSTASEEGISEGLPKSWLALTSTFDSFFLLPCPPGSGLLQIENTSYGIEPVDSTSGFQHLVYQIEYNNTDFHISKENYSIKWSPGMIQRANPATPVSPCIFLFFSTCKKSE